MNPHWNYPSCRGGAIGALLAVALVLGGLLAACGGSSGTASVIIVTATPTVAPVVLVVTATPTPAAPAEGQPPAATAVQPPPTAEQPPAEPTIGLDQIMTAQAILTQSAPTPTDTPPVPTDTPVPPTDTPVPPTDIPAAPVATNTPKPAAPAASLASYGLIYSNFDGGSEADATKYTIWIVRGDGSSASKILDTAIMPAYSPNGQKVAYYKTFEGIAVFDAPKKSMSMVVPNNWAEFASFSPDGKKLVFHEWVGSWRSADVSVFTVNADGSGKTKLTPGERPAWSPKGDLIAYDSCQGTSCGIFVVKPNGQGVRQVTSDAGGNAAWSPDAKKIVYNCSSDGDSEIWVVNADGSGRKQLTKNTGNDANPSYSPDGQYVFYVSDQNGTAWALRVMRADGSDVKTIRKIGIAPRWQFARIWAGWW